MIYPTYLSDKDRVTLDKLQKRLPMITDPTVREETVKTISEIESRRKPLAECSAEEALELRDFLNGQIRKLTQIGRSNSGFSLSVMVRNVEGYLGQLALEKMKLQEEKRQKALEDELNGVKRETRRNRPGSQATGPRNPWTRRSADQDDGVQDED